MQVARPTIDELVVGDEPAAWRHAGFTVEDDGICRIGTVRVRLAGRGAGKGLRTWVLRGVTPGVTDIDGIPTGASDRPPVEGAVHPNGTRSIDHLVLTSPDGERTATAITDATGLAVRRVRDTEAGGAPMRQFFFRLGEVVLELVAPKEAVDGPCRFFGLAFTVEDLDSLTGRYGEHLGRSKEAVQPGRQIVTLRHRDLDLSVPIAFMTAEPP